jgi:hypothetical protein
MKHGDILWDLTRRNVDSTNKNEDLIELYPLVMLQFAIENGE